MIFWLIAACMVVIALVFVLPTLLRPDETVKEVSHDALTLEVYRTQLKELERDFGNDVISADQYEKAKAELEARLIEEVDEQALHAKGKQLSQEGARSVALIVLILLPLVAVPMYLSLGTPELAGAMVSGEMPSAQAAAGTTDGKHDTSAQQVEKMIAQLKERLKSEPNDQEGWLMLARSYRFLKRYQEAATAYDRAFKLIEANNLIVDPRNYSDFADTLAMASGGNLAGRPLELLRKALELDPNHVTSLWLLGTEAFNKEDYVGALKYWRRLYTLMPEGSQDREIMAANIRESEKLIRERGGEVPPSDVAVAEAVPSSGGAQATAGQGASRITGTVRLAENYADRADPDDTVFIFARAAQGPRMPLAIVRKQVRDLPATFVLDESSAMMPQMSLANFKEVVVGARISKSGNAMPQSGDLQGLARAVKVGTEGLTIEINSIVP